MVHIWENFRAEQVYRSDLIGVVRTGARWLTLMSIGWAWCDGSLRIRPRSLLDNSPLRALADPDDRAGTAGSAAWSTDICAPLLACRPPPATAQAAHVTF